MIPISSGRNRYVTGWDGVRALSVTAVILFHYWPTIAPGGFLGVTTFLVLAGVLAVQRIGGELVTTGGFDWQDYARGRIRRLLPALLTYAAAVLVWTYATEPAIYSEITADAAAAVGYVTPWREMVGTVSYESAFDSAPAPFLHTWSLGVEELAWILTGLAIAATRRAWTAVAATLAAGAIGYALWVGGSDLYYSPARLTEFGIGAAVGLMLLRRPVPVPWPLTLIALGVLSWWALSWTVADVYSGRLIVAAATSAVVVMGSVTGPVARLLSARPLRWAGTRSYALYLWHVGVGELTDLPPLAAVAATATLAELSFRLVEEPVRTRSLVPRGGIAVLAALTAAVTLVCVAGPRPGIGGSPAAALTVTAPTTAVGYRITRATTGPDPAAMPDRVVPATGKDEVSKSTAVEDAGRRPRSITVVGDSTGFRLADALTAWGQPYGIEVVNAAKGGCSPASMAWDLHLGHPDLPAIPANDECTPDPALIRAGELVIVSYQGLMAMEHRRPGGEWVTVDREPRLRLALGEGLAAIAAIADSPVLYLSVPEPLLDEITPAAVAAANATLAEVVARGDEAELVDTSAIDSDPTRYPRGDKMHLDPEGVAAFVLDVLDPVMVIGRA